MSPQVVHFLRIIFGPGRSSVPDPIFDNKGNLDRYPDPDDYAPQFFAADPNWETPNSTTHNHFPEENHDQNRTH